VSSENNGIDTLEIVFSVLNPYVTINVRVAPESSDSETMIVTTRIEAHKFVENEYSFENDEQIISFIGEMKETPKSVFFDLTTDKAHDIMGAKYAKGTS